MKTHIRNQRFCTHAVALLVTLIAIYIRYEGLEYISSDFKNCLNSWYLEILNAGPGIEALRAYTGDYPMPYAFLIWLLTKIPVPFLYSLKTVNGIFDIILAVLVGKIVQYFKPESSNGFCLGYCITLLLPNVFLNSCYWGQCDGFYNVFLMASILCLLYKKYPAMMLFMGLALSYKLQAIFLLPFIMIFYWMKKEFSVIQFLIVPATMLFMNIPAVMAGYSPLITFTKYIGQAGGYPWLYYFYPNLWFFFQARPYYLFSTGAVLLAISALLLFVVLLVKKNVSLDRDNMLPILLWVVYTCVFFLPSMHERYGFFAEIIAVILAIVYVRSSWIAVLMSLLALPKYLWALSLMDNPTGLQMAEAIGNTALYMIFTCILWYRLFRKEGGVNHVQA